MYGSNALEDQGSRASMTDLWQAQGGSQGEDAQHACGVGKLFEASEAALCKSRFPTLGGARFASRRAGYRPPSRWRPRGRQSRLLPHSPLSSRLGRGLSHR